MLLCLFFLFFPLPTTRAHLVPCAYPPAAAVRPLVGWTAVWILADPTSDKRKKEKKRMCHLLRSTRYGAGRAARGSDRTGSCRELVDSRAEEQPRCFSSLLSQHHKMLTHRLSPLARSATCCQITHIHLTASGFWSRETKPP